MTHSQAMKHYYSFCRKMLVRVMVVSVMCFGIPASAQSVSEGEALRNEMLAGSMAGVDEIVFAVRSLFDGVEGRWGWDGHWYANIGYYATAPEHTTYGKGGRLCKLDVRTGKMTVLLEDVKGSVRDPVVHYDGRRILFSYRRGGTDNYLLYMINSDGTGLTRITDGTYDDFEACWLPDGGIVFVTTRAKRWVNCWLTQAANIWRCDADGQNMRALSANIEQDNTPWVLSDGRILYMRWEYVDRSQLDYHHLWTMNPDGSGQTVFFGNMNPGGVFIDAKPIPKSDDIVLIHSPGHGEMEHAGMLATISGKGGPDDLGRLKSISGGMRDPWAFSTDTFMAAKGNSILLVNGRGQNVPLYTLPADYAGVWLHEPRPIIPHAREGLVSSRVDMKKSTGSYMLVNAYHGRNMAGIKPGEIKKMMIVETLPKPVNFDGLSVGYPLSYGGTFTLERVLGVVPVEADGSAHFEVPALRSLFFILLDEKGRSLKRMQSFTTVQPGEVSVCLDCHEKRTATPPVNGRTAIAFKRAPSVMEPVRDLPDVPDFPRDIQPILDRNCLACHDSDKRSGGVVLSGDRGPIFSLSYAALTVWKQIADGRNRPISDCAPRTLGSGGSALIRKLEDRHHDVRITAREMDMMRLWLDLGAPYPGTYAALGTGAIGGYIARQQCQENDKDWLETKAAQAVFTDRCVSCHAPETHPVPRSLSDEMGIQIWYPMNLDDPRFKYGRHMVFNLSNPAKSLILLAPLAKSAGGYGRCKDRSTAVAAGSGIFKDRNDPGYDRILAMIERGKRRLEDIKRFDMPGFKPCVQYIREMKRYKLLPGGFDLEKDPVNVYEMDRKYWDSFIYKPDGGE